MRTVETMTRRCFMKKIMAGSACLLASGTPGRLAQAAGSGKPNVVFLLADDMGYGDAGCYGCPDINTPNIDQMAAEGARFTDGYANAPLCSPTRVAFVTGQYQQRLGNVFEEDMGGGALGVDPKRNPTIAMYLKEAGYKTACYGKWHVGGTDNISPNEHGFDHWVGLIYHNVNYFTHMPHIGFWDLSGVVWLYEDGRVLHKPGYLTDIIGDYTVDYIENSGPEPFFIYVPWQTPHDPIQAPDDDPNAVPPTGTTPALRPTYIKMIERLDYQIGRIMQALKDKGIDNNTLVVFSSDNGGLEVARNLPLKGFKPSLDEGGIREPFIMRWPGVIAAGQVTGQMAITFDVTATIMALAGAKPRHDRPLDGIDLMPYVRIDSPIPPDTNRILYWRKRDTNCSLGTNSILSKAIRKGNFKYLHKVSEGTEHLYDLAADISETNNLIADPAQASRVAELKALLEAWEAEVTPSHPACEYPPLADSDINNDELVDIKDFATMAKDWLKGI